MLGFFIGSSLSRVIEKKITCSYKNSLKPDCFVYLAIVSGQVVVMTSAVRSPAHLQRVRNIALGFEQKVAASSVTRRVGECTVLEANKLPTQYYCTVVSENYFVRPFLNCEPFEA